jgi:hypothetical protein
MPRSMRERRRMVTSLVALGLLASACVSPDRPGVTMTRLEANLVFGLGEEPEAAVPVPVPAEPMVEAASSDPMTIRVPFINPAAGRLPDFPAPPPGPAQECPPAPPTAAARAAAGPEVTVLPEPGIWSWKRGGSFTVEVDGQPLVTELAGFEVRAVRRVTETPADRWDDEAYTYQTVQPHFEGGGVRVMTWQVRPNTSAQQSVGGGSTVLDVTTIGEPERGLTLIEIQDLDSTGTLRAAWAPPRGAGLLYLPLPVAGGEQYRSVATDPRTGMTIVHDAHVLGRVRIDACGEVVDGWRVEATQLRSDESEPVTYNYVVAPQMGAVIIAEEVESAPSPARRYEVSFHIGQIDLDPLPEELE